MHTNSVAGRNRIATFLIGIALCGIAVGQETTGTSPDPTLIQQMAGTWKVQQRMWPGLGAEAVPLPAAVARRTLMPGGFLEEVMEPANKSAPDSFKRIAYFNYNDMSRQFEYFSLDSRAPQMMNERSDAIGQADASKAVINLEGGRFVAPRWGEAKNVAFTYRLTIGPIQDAEQVVQLYLKPESGENQREFLAFEYIYTRGSPAGGFSE